MLEYVLMVANLVDQCIPRMSYLSGVRLVLMAYREIVAPEAWHRALKYCVLAPVLYGPTFCAVLNVETRWGAHVKRNHVIIRVPTECPC